MHLVLKSKITDEYNIIAYEDYKAYELDDDYLYEYLIIYASSYENCYEYCMKIIEGEC